MTAPISSVIPRTNTSSFLRYEDIIYQLQRLLIGIRFITFHSFVQISIRRLLYKLHDMPHTLSETVNFAVSILPVSPIFKSRALGALLGVHAGDSLGATLEFTDHASARAHYPHGLRDILGGGVFNWPVGQATDDTDLTRAVLLAHRDALVDGAEDIPKTAGKYMLDWLHGRWPGREIGSSPVDIGGATRTGLMRFEKTQEPL